MASTFMDVICFCNGFYRGNFIITDTAQKHARIKNELRKLLIQHRLTLEVEARAESGSLYLAFRDKRMGKIRIADHPERHYAYRWHLRTDLEKPEVITSKGHKQFIFPCRHVKDLRTAIASMVGYHKAILKNTENKQKTLFVLNE